MRWPDKVDVDLSTMKNAGEQMPDHHKVPRQIIGISMSPDMAADVKKEASRRGITIRNLFEEMWAEYGKTKRK